MTLALNWVPGAQQRQGLDTGGKLFRGDSVAEIWREWQYGGEYASVKSLLHESKSSGKMTYVPERISQSACKQLPWRIAQSLCQ